MTSPNPSRTAAATAARLAKKAERDAQAAAVTPLGAAAARAAVDGFLTEPQLPGGDQSAIHEAASADAGATEASVFSVKQTPPLAPAAEVKEEEPIQIGQLGTLAPVKPPIAPIVFEPLGPAPEFMPALIPDGVNFVNKRLLAFVDPVKAQAFRAAFKDMGDYDGFVVVAYGERLPSASVGSPRFKGLMVQQYHPEHRKMLNPDAHHRWLESLRVLSRGPLVVF